MGGWGLVVNFAFPSAPSRAKQRLMIWIVFATMTGAAVLAFLWPLAAKRNVASRLDIETNLYHAELADIDRDVKRGLMTEADAQAAKAEAARRLLAATAVEPAQAGPRGVKYASLAVILIVPILTVGLYLRLGAPDYADLPLQARLQAQPSNMDMAAALARIEGHLAQEPDDARGWEIMAQVYVRLERPGLVALLLGRQREIEARLHARGFGDQRFLEGGDRLLVHPALFGENEALPQSRQKLR